MSYEDRQRERDQENRQGGMQGGMQGGGQNQGQSGRQGNGEYENLAEKSARTPGSASNLAMMLKGIDMPASKQELLRHAQQNGASQDVQSYIENMPERTYYSMADVEKEFGKIK